MKALSIARNTVREAVRDRVFSLVAVFGLLLVISSVIMSPLTVGAQTKIVADVGLGAMTFFSLLVILLVGAGMVHKEIDKRTIITLLSKPVTRLEFLLGKSLGLLVIIAVMLAAMAALFVVAVWITPTHFHPVYLVSVFLSLCEMFVVTSVVMFFSSFTTPMLTSLFTLAVFVAGHSLDDLRAFASTLDSKSAAIGAAALRWLLPNLEVFNIRNAAVHGLPVSGGHVLWCVAYAALYSAAMLWLAALLFQRREFR